MICPKCEREMDTGFIQGGACIIWTRKKHKISISPRLNGDDTILARNIYYPMSSGLAYRCRPCGFVITPIPPQNSK